VEHGAIFTELARPRDLRQAQHRLDAFVTDREAEQLVPVRRDRLDRRSRAKKNATRSDRGRDVEASADARGRERRADVERANGHADFATRRRSAEPLPMTNAFGQVPGLVRGLDQKIVALRG